MGCILTDPNVAMPECVELLGAGAEAFYDLRHQEIYNAMVGMFDNRELIDVVTLYQRLKDKNLSDEIGGLRYLASLPESCVSAHNISYYLEILHEKHVLRKMVSTCTEAVASIYEHEGDVPTLIDNVERKILQVRQSAATKGQVTARELVKHTMKSIEDLQNQNMGACTGVATGYPDLDKLTWGFQPGEMIVIAARPSVGKTSLAMNIAEHVTIDQQLPVGVFSLEMTAESLMFRMVCSRARVNLRNVRDGFLTERDYPKLTNAAGKLSSAPLYIDSSSGLSIMQLRAKARRMWQQHGIKLFIVDYLQLLNAQGSQRRSDSRQQEVADISAGMKTLARELNVPVVVLSQLSRDIEREKNRRPRLSDLRESGAIEQDADLVAFLYNYKEQEDDDDDPDCPMVNLLIAKQRSGPTGIVRLCFLKIYTRFESSAKVSHEDVPAADRQETLNYRGNPND